MDDLDHSLEDLLVEIGGVDESVVPFLVVQFYSLEVVRLAALLEDLLKDGLEEHLVAQDNQLLC